MKKRTGLVAAALSTTLILGSVTPAFAENAQNISAENEGNDTPSDDDKEENGDSKDPWNKNGASSEGPLDGSFGSSGLNRLERYVNSNHFESVSAIVAALAGVVTVATQLAALIIKINPAAKAQFESLFKK
ncbi:hypothetical protein KBP53_07685 [Corynebacterium genitalium ATCC 33030]|uniref:hypothetical protein n=1 Tax=Corynebacterium genitalium TaxID=38288 RepID=UPI0002FF09EC|nr:hypothetical protein [Corynebacterium genitalium]UUA88795.1 hypothetical protein KBP53_07685 [Corynebacterium genitalium ATCC 33030]